jgi:hypothetical protein
MVSFVIGRRSEDPSRAVSRVNVVALAILIGSVLLGALGSWAKDNPIPLLTMAVVGVVLMQSPRIAKQWEHAGFAAGQFVRLR